MSKESDIVLVVDDDAAVRSALKFALELDGLRVRLYDGASALLADRNLPADGCLVVDYRMPIMDGLELIENLRRRNVWMPALLITGRANKELRSRARKVGVHGVLEKPLLGGVLTEVIRSVLAKPH